MQRCVSTSTSQNLYYMAMGCMLSAHNYCACTHLDNLGNNTDSRYISLLFLWLQQNQWIKDNEGPLVACIAVACSTEANSANATRATSSVSLLQCLGMSSRLILVRITSKSRKKPCLFLSLSSQFSAWWSHSIILQHSVDSTPASQLAVAPNHNLARKWVPTYRPCTLELWVRQIAKIT